MKKMSRLWAGLLVVLAAVVSLSGEAEGFITTIGAHAVECFREDAPKGENVKLLFQVLDGGDLDVDFEILDPAGGRVFDGQRQTEGKYDFRAAQSGQYRFCFSNGHSSSADKRLSVDVTVGDAVDTGFAHATEDGDPLSPLEESVLALSQGVQDVKDDQEYMLMRDIAHKSVTDATNRRVLLWFVFELVLILSLAFWQVFYVRRFFEIKRAV